MFSPLPTQRRTVVGWAVAALGENAVHFDECDMFVQVGGCTTLARCEVRSVSSSCRKDMMITRLPGEIEMCRSAIDADHTRAGGAGDHVGDYSGSCGDVDNEHLLAVDDVRRCHQLGIDGDKPDIVQIGLGHRRPVNLASEQCLLRPRLSSRIRNGPFSVECGLDGLLYIGKANLYECARKTLGLFLGATGEASNWLRGKIFRHSAGCHNPGEAQVRSLKSSPTRSPKRVSMAHVVPAPRACSAMSRSIRSPSWCRTE